MRMHNIFIKSTTITAVSGIVMSACLCFAADQSKINDILKRGKEYYDKGNSEMAMESFMTVLRTGGSSEQSALAREYLNRMMWNLGPGSESKTSLGEDKDEDARESQEQKIKEEKRRVRRRRGDPIRREPQVRQGPAPEIMEEYYERRMKSARSKIYDEFLLNKKISVIMKNKSKFRAVAVEVPQLFSNKTMYHKNAHKLLATLSKLFYNSPRTLIRIYPSRTKGAVSILDLQRATLISGHIDNTGIASERIELMFEDSDASFEDEAKSATLKSMLALRSGVIVFVLDELKRENSAKFFLKRHFVKDTSRSKAPYLSLGISEKTIKMDRKGGAVLEMTALSETKELAQWTLRILHTSGDIVWARSGQKPMMQSFFFEGKKDAFGEFAPLPNGTYTIEARAIDIQGERSKLKESIQISGSTARYVKKTLPPAPVRARAPDRRAKPPAPKKKAPPKKKKSVPIKAAQAAAVVSAGKAQVEQDIIGRIKSKAKAAPPATGSAAAAAASAAKLVPKPKKKAPKPKKAPEQEEPKQASGEGLLDINYKIMFAKNASKITPKEAVILAKVAKAATKHPSQRVGLIGYASPKEHNPEKLAKSRAQAVAKFLTKKYSLNTSRFLTEWGIGGTGQREVEIFVGE
ncbi:OmpA family protein [Elusimicrobiota bacterium]